MSRSKAIDRSKIRRVVLYARVSTDRQAKKETPIKGQIERMREYCEQHGYQVVRIFKDEGISGQTDKRPDFQEMIEIASERPKKFDAVLVWKFSRFARNLRDSIIYKDILRRKYRIDVISINESGEDEDKDFLAEYIQSIIDHTHTKAISEDCYRGMETLAKQGLTSGGVTPIGYCIVKKKVEGKIRNSYAIDESYAPVITRIFQMYSTVIGAKQIAITLNKEGLLTQKGHKWTNIRILDILANPVYTGTLVWGKTTRDYDGKTINSDPENIIRIENAHPAIIDSDTFERIQARLATFNPMNKTRIIQPRALNSNYLLSGFLRCQCGSPLSGTQAKSGKYAYYSCVKQCKMGKAQCEMRPIPQHHLENIVINYLKTGLLTEDNISLLLKNHKDKHESGSSKLKVRLKNVERELVAARKSRDNILDYIEVEGKFSDDDTGQRLRERKLQIINLELEQSQLKAAIINPPSCEISAADIRSYIIHCERILNEATIGEKKELLRSIIQGITVNWNGKEWAGILKYSFPASDISGTGNKVPGLVVNGSP